MKKSILFWVFISFCGAAFSQQNNQLDTIYYDRNWKGVSNASFAEYYRIIPITNDSLLRKPFRDYYITGELQSEGGYISIDRYDDSKSIFDGNWINYYKSGKIEQKGTRKNGKQEGEYISYYENGLTKIHTQFKNNLRNGIFTEFYESGDQYIQIEYVNGKPKNNYYVFFNKDGYSSKFRIKDGAPVWETPYIYDRKTVYRNGTPWQYYVKNGITVAQTNTTVKDYGKWYRIDLIISNNSTIPIEFDPSLISAYSIDKKEKQRDLAVWTSEQYMKKVKNAQTWKAIGVGLLEGLATAGAGYSTSTTNSSVHYNGRSNSYGTASVYGSGGSAHGSYSGNSSYSGSAYGTSTTTTYDATAAYQARVLSSQRMANFENAQWQERQAKDEGYIKRTTIYPGETITGYVHIERKSGVLIYITVDINGANYIYAWTYGK